MLKTQSTMSTIIEDEALRPDVGLSCEPELGSPDPHGENVHHGAGPMTAKTDVKSGPRNNQSVPRRRPTSRWLLTLFVVTGLGAVAAALDISALVLGKSDAVTVKTVAVERGPMRVTLTESGHLDSANNLSVINHCEWSTTLLSIVPEGTHVEEGQIICELDSSRLRERADKELIDLTESEAALHQARQAVKMQQAENDRRIAAGEMRVDMAELDLREFKEGSFIQQQDEIEGECALAAEELTQAREKYEYAKRVSAKGYQTQSELESARLKVSRAEISLQKAQNKKKLLEDFTYGRTMAELEANLRNSRLELARTKLKAGLAMSQMRISEISRERRAQRDREYLDRLLRNIEACTIRAPQTGQIVYRIDSLRRSQPETIEEGIGVRYRQELMRVPDFSRMQVEIDIHESQISAVEEGLPVLVHVESLGRTLRGVVDSVASIPSRRFRSNQIVREFETVIEITDDVTKEQGLMPGMSADVEILVSQRDSVLQLPVDSVIAIGSQQYAFVITENGPQARPVEIGETNDVSIEIVSGLSEGDHVVERPRIELADELIRLESQS